MRDRQAINQAINNANIMRTIVPRGISRASAKACAYYNRADGKTQALSDTIFKSAILWYDAVKMQ